MARPSKKKPNTRNEQRIAKALHSATGCGYNRALHRVREAARTHEIPSNIAEAVELLTSGNLAPTDIPKASCSAYNGTRLPQVTLGGEPQWSQHGAEGDFSELLRATPAAGYQPIVLDTLPPYSSPILPPEERTNDEASRRLDSLLAFLQSDDGQPFATGRNARQLKAERPEFFSPEEVDKAP